MANRNDQNLKKAARQAEKEKRLAYQQHFEEKVDKFLRAIENENFGTDDENFSIHKITPAATRKQKAKIYKHSAMGAEIIIIH